VYRSIYDLSKEVYPSVKLLSNVRPECFGYFDIGIPALDEFGCKIGSGAGSVSTPVECWVIFTDAIPPTCPESFEKVFLVKDVFIFP
jgi:hypothetical protein